MVDRNVKKPRIPQKKAYHHGDLRRALVLAARAQVESGDPAAPTLRAAAQRAGVSATAPYRHFADRDTLLAAVLQEGFEELVSHTDAARLTAENPLAAYIAVGQAYLTFAAQHPALYRLMFGPECNKVMHPQLLAAGKAAFGVVLTAANDCAKAGLLGTRAPQEAALAGWVGVHGLASLHADGILGLVLPIDLEQAAQAVLEILLAGIASQK